MAFGYASLFGTTVVRIAHMPERPKELDGCVYLLKVPSGIDESLLRNVLERTNVDGLTQDSAVRTIASMEWQDEKVREGFEPRPENGRYRVQFSSHAEALEALELFASSQRFLRPELGHAELQVEYYDKPLEKRGWPVFEKAVSTEAIARTAYYSKISAILDNIGAPKMVEIAPDGTPEPLSTFMPAREGAGPRITLMRKAIREADFTGRGDAETVVNLFNDFARQVATMFVSVSKGLEEKVTWTWEGMQDENGKQHGMGRSYSSDGTIFEGTYSHGSREGPGKQVFTNGDIFEGSYKNDKRDGLGRMHFFNGNIVEAQYGQNLRTGTLGLKYANGNVYAGELFQGKRGGHQNTRTSKPGKLLFTNGDVYEGQFKNDQYDGFGTLRFNSGDMYEGHWSDGILDFSGSAPFKITYVSPQMGALASGLLKMQEAQSASQSKLYDVQDQMKALEEGAGSQFATRSSLPSGGEKFHRQVSERGLVVV